MSDLIEVKELFSSTQKTVEALRGKVEELEGKAADVVDNDTLSKMKADLSALFEAEQKSNSDRLVEVETKLNRPGAPGEKKDDEYATKFVQYLRDGEGVAEIKAMGTQTAASGGFWF